MLKFLNVHIRYKTFFSVQDRQKEQMRKRHDDERDKINQKLDSEIRKEEAQVVKDLDNERERLIREKKNKQAAEIASRPDLSEDERKAVSVILLNCKHQLLYHSNMPGG